METMVFGYHIGQHSNMPVRLDPSLNTATVKCLEQETVNAVGLHLESAAQDCVNVKADL